ncbi:MucR family transcriptional regulator [Methylobacterium sp. Leaf117]|uniref:MucR family transcriptional regulator n=1 Tax=Methylobacterium sp. Leaf117 TaxID=1736260 RepID=UPI0032AEBDA1
MTAQTKKSNTPNALISFGDGKSYKTLKRHRTIRGINRPGMPGEVRSAPGLPDDLRQLLGAAFRAGSHHWA